MKRLVILLIGIVIITNLYGAPRGIRNNNPGNIVAGDKWLGRIGTDGKYVKFKSSVYGIRAIGKVINTYEKRYKINTVKGIITRWAPPSENNTQRYIKFVCSETGLKPTEKLNIFDAKGKLKKERTLKSLISAIVKMENGTTYSYSDKTYAQAFNLLK